MSKKYKKIAIITGSSGLVGSEAVKFFHSKKFRVIGIDNDMRSYFFGDKSSTVWNRDRLVNEFSNFKHYDIDVRNYNKLESLFKKFNKAIKIVIHTAAQPSHDWAAKEPLTDFSINAVATLNLLELTRNYCPKSSFVFTRTNKVYGYNPNKLPLVESEKRWEIDFSHKFFKYGIDESMSIDNAKHSLFGASKLAADVLVQEYGKYFGMNTVCFRAGCITGPAHSATKLHGFLAYLVYCAVKGKKYEVFGYKGKQVRDNIHSYDLVNAFWHYYLNPRSGEIYNIGGSRKINVSVLEAIQLINQVFGYKLNYSILEEPRKGDHKWYISDVKKFMKHYPKWDYEYTIEKILQELIKSCENNSTI